MKRWKIVLPSLIAISAMPLVSLVSCGEEKPIFEQSGEGGIIDNNSAIISIDWTPIEESIEFSNLSYSYNDGTSKTTNIVCLNPLARPCGFQITFDQNINNGITDGVFSFSYKKGTSILKKKASIKNIQINIDYMNSPTFYSFNENGQFLIYDHDTLISFDDIKAKNQTTQKDVYFKRDEFNEPLKIGKQVTQIGERFLNDCKLFNQELILPNNLELIGTLFLWNCYSFNQPLTLPNKLGTVGNSFLYSCNSYTETINIQDLDPTIFIKVQGNDYTLTTPNSDAPMYKTGIFIAGTKAEGFIKRFGHRSTNPFRNLKLAPTD